MDAQTLHKRLERDLGGVLHGAALRPEAPGHSGHVGVLVADHLAMEPDVVREAIGTLVAGLVKRSGELETITDRVFPEGLELLIRVGDRPAGSAYFRYRVGEALSVTVIAPPATV